MIIKKAHAISIYRFLSRFDLSKIKDKALRRFVRENWIKCHAAAKAFDEDGEALRKRLVEGIGQERIDAYAALRKEEADRDNPVTKERRAEIEDAIAQDYKDILAVERELQESAGERAEEEVDLDLITVTEDDLLDLCEKASVSVGCLDLDDYLAPLVKDDGTEDGKTKK